MMAIMILMMFSQEEKTTICKSKIDFDRRKSISTVEKISRRISCPRRVVMKTVKNDKKRFLIMIC